MGKFVTGIVTLIIGILIGAIGGVSLGGGAAMGVGVATGLSAGICSTVRAAREEGLMTAEQVDKVLRRAAVDLGGMAEGGGQVVGSAAQCDAVMAKLKAAD